MPVIQIHMLEGRDIEKKRLLAKRITDVVVDTLGSKPEKVRVLMYDMPNTDYAIGGVLVADE